jgi:RNA polymerase sigma factor (sigma-70 family)
MRSVQHVDDAFLNRLRQRDAEALRTIVEQHARQLYRAARGMGFRKEDAEDLAQEVLITFIESLDRFEGRSRVSTWLFGILHHKIQERRRTQAREGQNDSIAEMFEAQFDSRGNWIHPPIPPDRRLSSREAEEAVRRCLEGLPPLQREVFQLRQIEELSAADVGKILGQTVTHIAVMFHRARMKLRACLEGSGWGRSR